MPETLVDARGRQLIPSNPRRVVSLVPSLTETLVELGLVDRLVGRTRYCIHPVDRVQGIPSLGGTKNPNVDEIIALAPDLVLACVEENKEEHLAALEAAGLAVHSIMPRSLDDVARFLEHYALFFAAADAVKSCLTDLAAARGEAAAFRERLAAARGGKRVRSASLIWKSPWMASGGATYIHAVMGELGLEDAFGKRQDYFETDIDELLRLKLDLVLLPDEPYPFKEKERDELAAAGVAGGGEGLLLLEGELLTWYGTRTPRALRELMSLLARRYFPSA